MLRTIEDGDVPQTWDEYVKAVYRPARYADEIAFRAATSLLGISICFICGDLAKPSQVMHYRNPKSQISIYLRHSLGHYTLLLPHGDVPSYATLPLDALPPQAFAPRGGGDEQESWLETCDTSWIPSGARSPGTPTACTQEAEATVSADAGVAQHQWATALRPSPSTPRARGTHVGGEAAVETPVPRTLEDSRSKLNRGVKKGAAKVHWSTKAAQARKQAHNVGKRKFGWKCDVCKLRLVSEVFDNLRHLRNNHIRRVHKHVPKARFSRLGPKPHLPIDAVPDCKNPAWMCFHCRQFLPAGCHRNVKANSIARHIKSCSSCPAHWTPLKNLAAILEDQGICTGTEGLHQARLARRFKKVDLRQ